MLKLPFFKNKREILINKDIGIIEPTQEAIDNEVYDKFNKQIVIRKGVLVKGDKIIWGKVIEEVPYSQEAKESLEKIKGIIVVERKINRELLEEEEFGGILN